MPTSNRIVGITLVVIGLLILLGQMGVDFFGWLWPILLCVIGGGVLWSWYTRGDDSGKVFSGVLLVPPEKVKLSRPVPVIHFHGKLDPNVAYAGASGRTPTTRSNAPA